MEAAVNYLKRAGAETIRLEAVQEAVPLYRRIGFIGEFDSLRFRRQPRPFKESELKSRETFQMRDADLANVAKFDTPYFSVNRLSVLQSLYRDHSQLCFVAKRKGNIAGYIMARQTQNGFWIGPWVCLNSATARHLFNALVKTVGDGTSELRVGLPALNTRGQRLMENLGFESAGKSVHMVFGNRKNQSIARYVYGIGGPEKG
jgi:ribosomal protein S18 acetylase RimI-like enzyme